MRDRIIIGENGIGKWFIDDPFPDEIKENVIGYFDSFMFYGNHICHHSAIWEDVTGIVDDLQSEEQLPNKLFIVCYYYCDENYDLQQLVDWCITKKQIIENIKNQKYREGADYYLVNDLEVAE